jgi:hypothetical protein
MPKTPLRVVVAAFVIVEFAANFRLLSCGMDGKGNFGAGWQYYFDKDFGHSAKMVLGRFGKIAENANFLKIITKICFGILSTTLGGNNPFLGEGKERHTLVSFATLEWPNWPGDGQRTAQNANEPFLWPALLLPFPLSHPPWPFLWPFPSIQILPNSCPFPSNSAIPQAQFLPPPPIWTKISSPIYANANPSSSKMPMGTFPT